MTARAGWTTCNSGHRETTELGDKKLSVRHIVGMGVVVLLLSTSTTAVAQSEVADAAMRGDSVQVGTLLD